MNYFIIDMNRLLKSRQIRVTVLLLLAISIFDPLTVFLQYIKDNVTAEMLGRNPFQYWMLMNSVSWGNNLYNLMFWLFAVLFTGFLYFEDRNTSMFMYQIIRKSRMQYFLSKFLSVHVFSFLILLSVLEINVLITYLLFPETNTITQYFKDLAPNRGTFAYKAFQANPLIMIQIYTFLNSWALSLFVVFSLCVNVLFKVSNRYISFLLPVIILYAVTFIFDSYPGLFTYNIRMLIQPAAAYALSEIITWENVFTALGGWMLINFLLIILILFRARNSYD